MASTRLMRSPQKLAGERAAGERLGIEMAELRAREAKTDAEGVRAAGEALADLTR